VKRVANPTKALYIQVTFNSVYIVQGTPTEPQNTIHETYSA